MYRVENLPIACSANGTKVSKNARDYKKNADEVNRRVAIENLRRAEEYEKSGNVREMNNCLKSAALNFIDADEKYIKADIEFHGRVAEYIHDNRKLYEQSSLKGLLKEEDINFLDKFSNDKNKSSHTELEYGDYQPTIEEVRRLDVITEKLYLAVDEEMSVAKFTRLNLAIEDGNNLISYEDVDYHVRDEDK